MFSMGVSGILGGIKNRENADREFLRLSIAAELDAISLYEQIAELTEDQNLKKVMLDVAKEEKTHVGEFQAMLLALDKQQKDELAHGREEVEELTGQAAPNP